MHSSLRKDLYKRKEEVYCISKTHKMGPFWRKMEQSRSDASSELRSRSSSRPLRSAITSGAGRWLSAVCLKFSMIMRSVVTFCSRNVLRFCSESKFSAPCVVLARYKRRARV